MRSTRNGGKGSKKKPNSTAKSLRGVKRAALDTSCFIYHYTSHPRFGSVSGEIFSLISKNKVEGLTSVITLVELVYQMKIGGGVETIDHDYVISQLPNLLVVFVDLEVAKVAANLRFKYKLKTPDAIQLATALVHDCDVFITNDKIFKRVKEIPNLFIKDLSK